MPVSRRICGIIILIVIKLSPSRAAGCGRMFPMKYSYASARRSLLWLALAGALLTGCRPTPLYFVQPEGPAEYQLGWQDGCDTGLSAQGNYLYRFAFGFKKRPEMGENDQYKQGWNEGFTYCRFAMAADQSDK
jgi:hypothetical protein